MRKVHRAVSLQADKQTCDKGGGGWTWSGGAIACEKSGRAADILATWRTKISSATTAKEPGLVIAAVAGSPQGLPVARNEVCSRNGWGSRRVSQEWRGLMVPSRWLCMAACRFRRESPRASLVELPRFKI